MVNWLLRWVISAVALAIVAHIPGLGISYHKGFSVLIEATVVIGLINSLIRPILDLLTLPLNCLTFGLFRVVLNAILFASVPYIVKGFQVNGLLGAVPGPILMGLLSGILFHLIPEKKEE